MYLLFCLIYFINIFFTLQNTNCPKEQNAHITLLYNMKLPHAKTWYQPLKAGSVLFDAVPFCTKLPILPMLSSPYTGP